MVSRRPRSAGALALVAAVSVLLVAGCSPDGKAPGPAGSSSAASSPASPVGASNATPAPAATGELPAGFHLVDVPEIGVRVAVPDDMTVLDAAVLTSGDAGAVLDEMAARLGLTHDQMATQAAQLPLYAADAKGTNINLAVIDMPRPPTADEIAPVLDQLGMHDAQITQRSTAVGPATSARGSVVVTDGAPPAYEQNLWAQTSTTVFSLTVTSGDEAVADSLFATELAALQPLG